MAVQTIGTRIARTFGSGKNLKHVVSEVVNGKTYTKVLDGNGNVIKNRVKAFSSANVGDKFVRTRTSIIQDADNKISKEVYDRVYGGEYCDDLLGMRKTTYHTDEFGDLYKSSVDKQAFNTHRYRKTFGEIGELTRSKSLLNTKKDIPNGVRLEAYTLGAQGGKDYHISTIRYSNKGLPLSEEVRVLDYNKYKDKSLRELCALHREVAPHKPYATYVNLGFLDNNVAHSQNLNNLDRFI